jgi:hypothetical protein
MPWLPALAAIAGLAGTGVSIGESIANSGGGAPSPKTPTAPTPTPPDANALLQRRQLIGSADSNTQAQTSGTAGDFYRLITDQLNSGTLGQAGSQGAANQTVFTPANSQPTNAAVAGQVPNLSDFLNSFSG